MWRFLTFALALALAVALALALALALAFALVFPFPFAIALARALENALITKKLNATQEHQAKPSKTKKKHNNI